MESGQVTKKTVHYRKGVLFTTPVVGGRVYLQTLDHPGPNVTNWPEGDGFVLTSIIESVGDNGIFETENTFYVPELST